MYVHVYHQAEVLANSWTVFDKYKDQFLIGELVWNFQDFESYESEQLYTLIYMYCMCTCVPATTCTFCHTIIYTSVLICAAVPVCH